MKKTKIILLSSSALALAPMVLPVVTGCSCAVRVKYLEDTNFKYELLDDGTYKVIQCKNVTDLITIPDKIENHEVTEVGSKFLQSNLDVKSVILPSSIKKINYAAFMNCYNLSTINFAGSNADSKLEVIDQYAFTGCHSLKVADLPSSLKTIGSFAFQSCVTLSTLYIPSSVTEIGIDAFNGCSNAIFLIQAETIPSTWNEKWNSSNRPYITNCDAESRLFDYTNAEDQITYKCYLGANDQVYLVSASNYKNNTIQINLPSKVTKKIYDEQTKTWSEKEYQVSTVIGGCFAEKEPKVLSVVVPNSVTLLDGCFSGLICTNVYVPADGIVTDEWVTNFEKNSNCCRAYKNITLLDSYTSGKTTFDYIVVNNKAILINCPDSQTELVIPASITKETNIYPVAEVAPRAFIRKNALTNVTFPADATDTIDIGAYAFYDCRLLATVNVDNVKTIGNFAFAISALQSLDKNGVTSLKTTTINTNKLTSIGNNAFEKPYKVALDKYTELDTNIFDSTNAITTIGNSAFKNVVFKDNSKLYFNDNLNTLTGYEFNKIGYTAEGAKTGYTVEIYVYNVLFDKMVQKWGWTFEKQTGDYYLLKTKTNLGIAHIIIQE